MSVHFWLRQCCCVHCLVYKSSAAASIQRTQKAKTSVSCSNIPQPTHTQEGLEHQYMEPIQKSTICKKMIFVLISVTFLFVSVSVINSTTDRPERERTNIFQGNNTTMTRYITFVQYTAVMNYLQSTTTIHTCWTIFSCGNVFSIHSTWHSFSSGE